VEFRELIIAVYSDNRKINICSLGKMKTLLMLQQVVHIVTTILYRVKDLIPEEAAEFTKETARKLFL
jgi:hypothetical protein